MGQAWDTPGSWRAPVSRHGFTDGAQRLPAPAIGSSRNPVCQRCGRHRRGATAAAICRCHQPDFDDAPARLNDRRAFVSFLAAVMAQCLRVVKPGGHAIVWAIPRTSHWTATALEDAGFDVRDVITHHYGSGFPKSLNLKGDWQGWGTALKPASEHWILARRPLSEANRARRATARRRFAARTPRIARNHHPTVKSVVLMRYLCQLITPPGGLILDCFAGSGSTLIAAASLGFRAIGIEREADYVEIIRRRLDRAEKHASIQMVSA